VDDRWLSRTAWFRVVDAVIPAIRREQPPAAVIAAYLILVAALVIHTAFAAVYERFPGDVWLTREIQSIDIAALTRAMRFSTNITSPTNSLIALAFAVTVLLALRHPRLAVFLVAAMSAHALGGIIKLFVDRPRPDPDLVDVVRLEERFSYPSGHVEWVVSVEGFAVFAVWQLTGNAIIRVAAAAAWFTHLLLTSAGRIDQGLHWPSDIAGSYLVGAVALAAVIWAYRVSFHLVDVDGNPAPLLDARAHDLAQSQPRRQ
jgi:undecaprenyl-diphosphatase